MHLRLLHPLPLMALGIPNSLLGLLLIPFSIQFLGFWGYYLYYVLCDSILVLILGFHLKKNTLRQPSLPVSVCPCWSFPQLHPRAPFGT